MFRPARLRLAAWSGWSLQVTAPAGPGAVCKNPAMKAGPSNERRLWWQIFGLLVLVCSVWALAVPPMTGPDESSNAIRAAAVVRGQWTGNAKPEINGNPKFANVMVEVEVP